ARRPARRGWQARLRRVHPCAGTRARRPRWWAPRARGSSLPTRHVGRGSRECGGGRDCARGPRGLGGRMWNRRHGGHRWPNARKVRLRAAELDIPLDRVALDFSKGEMRSAEYLAKNPNGKVPTIDDDGFVLFESCAILSYLASKRPERGLVPTDPKERAIL